MSAAGWDCSYVSNRGVAGATGTVVVIDVLRAFSTAAWAFELGADRIVLTDDLDEALAIKASLPGALALKDGEPAPGFDLTNSPVQLQHYGLLAGRTIVQRTTAGTVGAVAARDAEALYCASFLCAAATARAIRAAGPCPVVFVVSGDDGRGEEDRAAAEYIAALLADPEASPDAYLAAAEASRAASTLRRRVADGSLGTDAGDVAACLEVNRFDFAMRARLEDGLLVLRRESSLA